MALRQSPPSFIIRHANGQSATCWLVAGRVSGNCQQVTSSKPTASTSRPLNTPR